MTRVVSRFFTDYCPTEVPLTSACANFKAPTVTNLTVEKQLNHEKTNCEIEGKQAMIENPAHSTPKLTSVESSTSGRKNRRIFLAKIPAHISEEEMKEHFEAFGEVEDAYRPKDFTKNTYRGIGFVTFVDAARIDKVISQKHKLGGVEIVVDKATPKQTNLEITKIPNTHSAKESTLSTKMDEAAISSANQMPPSFPTSADWLQFSNCPNLENGSIDHSYLAKYKSPAGSYATSNGTNRGPPSHLSDDLAEISPRGDYESSSGTVLTASPRVRSNRSSKSERSTKQLASDNLSHVRKVRGGPRIFVGKLAKDTVEQDLADYFGKFGFVMDVYIPRSKENKKEHRGFGFVTFETEASIKRTVAQGTHTLKGAVVAIDVAVPENATSY